MLAKRKGILAFKKSHIDTLSSDDTTKIMEPKGGVNPPIAIFSVITMPKWTRSIFSVFNIGTKSGASISCCIFRFTVHSPKISFLRNSPSFSRSKARDGFSSDVFPSAVRFF